MILTKAEYQALICAVADHVEVKRYSTEGIYFDVSRAEPALVSTDGRRLVAVYGSDADMPPAPVFSAILTVAAFKRRSLQIGSKRSGQYRFIWAPPEKDEEIDGKYPQWRHLIPSDWETYPKALSFENDGAVYVHQPSGWTAQYLEDVVPLAPITLRRTAGHAHCRQAIGRVGNLTYLLMPCSTVTEDEADEQAKAEELAAAEKGGEA